MAEELTAEERARELHRDYQNILSPATLIAKAIREAEDRGYNRAKAEGVVLRSQSRHGFLSGSISEAYGTQTDRCICGQEFTCDMFETNDALNDHIRQAWIEQFKAEQQPACEWEDLKHLSGRELRDALKERSSEWKSAWKTLEQYDDRADMRVLIARIQDMELPVTQEAERLWDEYLNSFEEGINTPEGQQRCVEALGARYLGVVIERAAEKKRRSEIISASKQGETAE